MKTGLLTAFLSISVAIFSDITGRCQGDFYPDEQVVSYDNAPLSDVIKKLSAWYGLKIVLDEKSLYSSRITCVLKKKSSLTCAIHILEMAMDLTSYFKQGEFHFRRKQ